MYVTPSSFKKKIVTLILVAINVGVYLVVNVYLDSISGTFWLYNLAQHNDSIFKFGDYYRLFTAMFVHADLYHLLSNMLFLVIFGLLVENRYSVIQYLLIYLVSGFLGNVVSLIALSPYVFSLGASGCIFGVMGAYYVSFTAYDKRMIIYAVVSTLVMVGLSIGVDINSWAHLLGAIGGFLLGGLFTYLKKRKMQYLSLNRSEQEARYDDHIEDKDDEEIEDY